jgi:hypothetical protein
VETDFDVIAAGLRAWTRTHDQHVRAAVDLLIWHEHWLRRADFRKAALDSAGGVIRIGWREAREFAESNPGASTSEMAILDLAVAIGEDRYRLRIMGDAHAKAIVRAFAQALGEERADG